MNSGIYEGCTCPNCLAARESVNKVERTIREVERTIREVERTIREIARVAGILSVMRLNENVGGPMYRTPAAAREYIEEVLERAIGNLSREPFGDSTARSLEELRKIE